MEMPRSPVVTVSFAVVVLAAGSWVGCSYSSTAETSIDRDDLGSKYARQSGYMQMAGEGGGDKEPVPEGIRHEVLLDRVTLTKADRDETCFDVTLRTSSKYDEPISQVAPRCLIDGDEHDAVASDAKVSVYDYDYQGREKTAVVEGVAAGEYVRLETSRPAEKTFRVIERSASVCCPEGGSERVGFLVENDRAPGFPFVLKFTWNLE